MPRLKSDDMETGNIGGIQAFKFSGVRPEKLGSTEYTIVTMAIDTTGSVYGFEKELRNCLIAAVDACKKSQRSDYLLIRVIFFSTTYQNGIEEIHGFKPLSEIDTQAYPTIYPGGMTPLCDAVFSSVGSVNEYAEKLAAKDYLANGIVFIITDGVDNASVTTPKMIKEQITKAITGEEIKSLETILIGINAQSCSQWLSEFQREAEIAKYIDAGDVSEEKLAKIADFVSQSISSQSQSLVTGDASQNISVTI